MMASEGHNPESMNVNAEDPSSWVKLSRVEYDALCWEVETYRTQYGPLHLPDTVCVFPNKTGGAVPEEMDAPIPVSSLLDPVGVAPKQDDEASHNAIFAVTGSDDGASGFIQQPLTPESGVSPSETDAEAILSILSFSDDELPEENLLDTTLAGSLGFSASHHDAIRHYGFKRVKR